MVKQKMAKEKNKMAYIGKKYYTFGEVIFLVGAVMGVVALCNLLIGLRVNPFVIGSVLLLMIGINTIYMENKK